MTARRAPSSKDADGALDELRAQLRIAGPTIVSMLLYKLPWLFSLKFAGALGSEALASAALATTICNVTGMSFAVGLSFGLTTLTGQARGDLLRRGRAAGVGEEEICGGSHITDRIRRAADGAVTTSSGRTRRQGCEVEEEKKETDPLLGDPSSSLAGESDNGVELIQPLVFLFRGLAVQLLLVVPIGIWWICGTKSTLLALGQGERLSGMTETYLRILTPGLWSFSVCYTLTTWLQTIDMADVPAYAAFVGFALHVPTNVLFVRVLGLGIDGVALATVVFQVIQPVLMLVYLFGTARGRRRVLESTGASAVGIVDLGARRELVASLSMDGARNYLVLALPGVVVISEWWASEVSIFLAGELQPDPDYGLGGMSIYQSINTFCFMFPIGFSAACSARVGLFLGLNDAGKAKQASRVGMLGALVLSMTMGGIIYLTPRRFFPSLFTSDDHVIESAGATMPFLAVYVLADGMQTCLNAILKGCGMQHAAMPVVIVAYWMVGVPLAYYLAFYRSHGTTDCDRAPLCGTAGLVAGMTVGTWSHFVLLLAVTLSTVDWKNEAQKAQERIALEKSKIELE